MEKTKKKAVTRLDRVLESCEGDRTKLNTGERIPYDDNYKNQDYKAIALLKSTLRSMRSNALSLSLEVAKHAGSKVPPWQSKICCDKRTKAARRCTQTGYRERGKSTGTTVQPGQLPLAETTQSRIGPIGLGKQATNKRTTETQAQPSAEQAAQAPSRDPTMPEPVQTRTASPRRTPGQTLCLKKRFESASDAK
jgi:hypothetical protein